MRGLMFSTNTVIGRPFILKRYNRDLWGLEHIPLHGEERIAATEYDVRGALVARTQKKDYVWPDEFRVDAWERNEKRTLKLSIAWH